jgi:hypothetical protein
VAILTALTATLEFDFFYLPPVGTLTVDSPADWLVLGAFLLAALVISGLVSSSARVRERNSQLEGVLGRYQALAETLLSLEGDRVSLTGIAETVLETLDLDYCSLHVFLKGRWEHYRGAAVRNLDTAVEESLAGFDHHLDVQELSDERDRGVRFFPVRRDDSTLVLLAMQSDLPAAALGAVAYLVGLRITSLVEGE